MPVTSKQITAIGGIGGSGTRLIAKVLMHQGFNLGSCLNKALDNLWFPYLFKYLAYNSNIDSIKKYYSILKTASEGIALSPTQRQQVQELSFASTKELFGDAKNSLLQAPTSIINQGKNWGWKAPNTHIFIDRLWQLEPEIKYIHVIRHGLDMSLSSNQNQARLWGKDFTGETYRNSPQYHLKYWVAAHKRLFSSIKKGSLNFHLINYDTLCSSPAIEIEQLFTFLGFQLNKSEIAELSGLIVANPSRGRYQKLDLSVFDDSDLDYVQTLGMDF